MNKRIKELDKQAQDMNYRSSNESGRWMENYVETFAKLIIKECLSIVKSNTYGPNGEYDYS